MRHSEVTALDVSAEALAIAAENATFNHTAVAFLLHDILGPNLPPEFALEHSTWSSATLRMSPTGNGT
ncbi:MAG: hypothetical protein ACLTZY_13615 [Alistipes indistinctus]